MSIYLDNAATTPLNPNVKEYIIDILDQFHNPSSVYQDGLESRKILEIARNNVADFIKTKPDNIIFTSGGSASNTLAIRGYFEKHNGVVLYSSIAHKSIIKCVKGINSRRLDVDGSGYIDWHYFKKYLEIWREQSLVVIDYANSEIGTIQNVKGIIEFVHYFNGVVYLDCTGSISQIPVNAELLDADMIGFSGHKIGALKGCGVLYKKAEIELVPLIYGSQEQGLFGGTENLIGIASIGKACEVYDYSSVNAKARDYVWEYIVDNIPKSYLVGADLKNRLPHNLYVCFQGVNGESLLTLLDMNGIQVSTGSACNSGSRISSTVLTAIGMDEKDAHSCIRLTFSGKESKDELDYVCKKIKACVSTLRELA